MTKYQTQIARHSANSSFRFPSSFVIRISSLNWQVGHNDRRDKNIQQRDFEEKDPPQAHQLVITEPWQGESNPDKEEDEHRDFREKCHDIKQAAQHTGPAGSGAIDQRPMKSAAP